MYCNGHFEISLTKSSFEWSVLIMDKIECRRSTGINFGIFIVFDSDKRLVNGLQSNLKLFAGDTSLFSSLQDITASTVTLNRDPTKISEWAVQWKRNFNPDPCKQTQELLISQK